MKNKKLKIGIIGCGGIANQKHLPSLKTLSDKCEIVAFCDIKIERAEKAAKEYGVPNSLVCSDYKNLLVNKEIDVVHILTPNVSHCELTVAAFESNKHVMCEKPIASTSSDAKQMIEAWKKTDRKFTIGYQNRFRPEVQSLHESCVNNELGDIYFAYAPALRRKAVPTWGVFMDKAKQGGGPLIDIGTHALDMTLWMMNNYSPKSVSGSVFYKMADKVEGNAFGPWNPKEYEVEDSAFGFIKMQNGATIVLGASWILNIGKSREASTVLCGTEAGAEILDNSHVAYYRERHGLLTEEVNSSAGEFAYFNEDTAAEGILEATSWINAILEDKVPVSQPEQAYVVTQILEAIYESAKTGKEIIF